MRLIIIGCEYAGKTTLMQGVKKWMSETLGSCQSSFHDHFVVPFHEGSGPDIDKEIEVVLSMPPALLEKYSRYLIHYHLGSGFYKANDHGVVNWYYGDAVYAPIYYGFGRPGEYADRRVMARYYDAEVMDAAPDTVLLLLKASPDTIRRRLRENPHPHCPLQEGDVELVLSRFQEEFDHTLIRRLITLDTTDSTPEQTLHQFIREIEPHLTDRDLLRLNAHRALK